MVGGFETRIENEFHFHSLALIIDIYRNFDINNVIDVISYMGDR